MKDIKMNKSKLMNYTTNVPSEKSIMEIEHLLVGLGARRITKDHAADGVVTAFIFSFPMDDGRYIPFRMPCESDRVATVLLQSYKKFHRDTKKKIAQQANRVAWRIMLDWIKAEHAKILLNQVHPMQPFLSYAYNERTGKILFDAMQSSGFKLLTSSNP